LTDDLAALVPYGFTERVHALWNDRESPSALPGRVVRVDGGMLDAADSQPVGRRRDEDRVHVDGQHLHAGALRIRPRDDRPSRENLHDGLVLQRNPIADGNRRPGAAHALDVACADHATREVVLARESGA
jgi:hypothetical protein